MVTPEVRELIAKRWLQGRTASAIGREIGIDEKAVRYHMETFIRPLWHEKLVAMKGQELAKIDLLESTAWDRFLDAAPGEIVENIERALTEDGNRLRVIKKVMRQVTKVGDSAWLDLVKWCIDWRSKVFGYYAPTRHQIDTGSELRVAGKTPNEVDEAMFDRLVAKIAERRKYAAAVEQQQFGAGRN